MREFNEYDGELPFDMDELYIPDEDTDDEEEDIYDIELDYDDPIDKIDLEEINNDMKKFEQLHKEISELFGDDCKKVDELKFFFLLKEGLLEKKHGIIPWIEDWLGGYFCKNIGENEAYIVVDKNRHCEICIPLLNTTMEGIGLVHEKVMYGPYHIEYKSNGKEFIANCSAALAKDALTVFRIWVEGNEPSPSSYAEYHGYPHMALHYIKALAADKRIHSRDDAVEMARIYHEAIMLTSDIHMELVWQLVLNEFETMSDHVFYRIQKLNRGADGKHTE